MRSRPLVAVLLLVAAAAALVWLEPWASTDPSPQSLLPASGRGALAAGDRSAPAPAVLEPALTAPRKPQALDPPHATSPEDLAAKTRRAHSGPSGPIPQVPELTGRLVGEVVDADGKPVVGARVSLHRLPTPEEARPPKQPGESQRNVLWVFLATDITTDANGRFEVAAPEKTRLLVGIEPPTGLFWTGTVEGVDQPLRVALPRAYDVQGRVVDAVTGAPLANAQVVVNVPAPRLGQHEGRSDEQGAFRFGGLPEGPVELRASARSMRSDSLGLDSEPIPEGIDAQAQVRVPAGTEGVELRVWRGLELAGTVETERGDVPPRGVGIQIYARSAQGQPDQRRTARAGVSPDGKFVIDALPAGSYDLLFEPPAGSPDLAITWLRGVTPPTRDLRVILERGAVMKGRIVDESGQPVVAAGGFVYVIEEGTTWGGVDSRYATLDGKGGFATPALPSTRLYALLARGFPGYAEAQVKGVQAGRDDLVLTLRAAREIRGSVRDLEGKPVGAGVRVVAWMPGTDLRDGRMSSSFTDASGKFVIAGLTGERYALTAGGGGSAFAPVDPLLGVVPDGKPAEVQVQPGARLSGRLVDPRGNAVQTEGLHASHLVGGPADVTWTRVDDREGRFLLAGVRAGRIQLGLYRDAKYVALGEFEAPAADLKVVVPDP